MNVHVIDDASGRRLDLFPVLVSGETTTLHMERMRLRGVPTDVLLPPVPHRFRDHDVLVPHRPEAFLLDRYGPGWDVADPYDDWTWPLDRATGGAPPAATTVAGPPPPAHPPAPSPAPDEA